MPQPHRIIDSHQHAFWWHRDDAGLVADMNEHGIDYAWLLSWEIRPEEHPEAYTGVLNPTRVRADGTHQGIPLDDLLIAHRNYPDRFVLGFCPHPLSGDAPGRLKAAVAMHGVKVCGEWKFRIPFDDPRSINLLRTAGELGIPVVLHLDVPFLPDENGRPVYYPAWYGGTVDHLERALIACPETIFIGHAPGFWREISADAATTSELYPRGPLTAPGRLHCLLEKYDNLFADLSAGSGRYALERDPEHAKTFLKNFSNKLLFARDIYGTELRDFLATLNLDQETQDNIFWRNAEKLVPPPGTPITKG
jgi:predicted TIM-barrel fold metal-dependent hydrolase